MKPVYLTLTPAICVMLAMPALAMAEMDANGDGLITFDEVVAVAPETSEENFTLIDTNGDGTLDADEYAAAEEAGLLPVVSGG